MATYHFCIAVTILLSSSLVSGFMFDSTSSPSACDLYYSDFGSYHYTDASNHKQSAFLRRQPVLVREISFGVEDCPDYSALLNGNFSIKFLDAADPVLNSEFKTLIENPQVQEVKNNLFPSYKFGIQIDGPPQLSGFLKLESKIQSACTPEVIIKGCQPSGALCTPGCLNGGTCIGINTCNCPPGRAGDRCEQTFTKPEVYNMELGNSSSNGSIVTSVDGEFSFELTGEIDYVEYVNTKRDVGDKYRRGGHDGGHDGGHGGGHGGGHHGSFHTHGHGGSAGCKHHHGKDCNDILANNHHNSFTSSCGFSYGKDHSTDTHLYSSNHGHGHNTGASLVHSLNNLQMNVNNGHVQCTLNVPHTTQPNVNNVIASSFSPQYGCSLYVNGNHVGSQTAVPVSTNQSLGSPNPFCMGVCGTTSSNNNNPSNASLSNILFTAGSMQNMVTNGLASLLGNGFGQNAQKLSATTKPTPSTAKTTAAVTASHAAGVTTSPTTMTTQATTTLAPLISSPICYDCGPDSTDGQCQNLKKCPSGEICLVFEDQGKFTHKCLERRTCLTAKMTVSTGCWECCTGYLCNERCPVVCNDTPLCAVVKGTGYNVCGDAPFAQTNCQSSCNLCPSSG